MISVLYTVALAGICQLDFVDRATTASSACISCHDGTVSPGASGALDHPVAIEYKPFGPARLRPQPKPGIVLVSGRVECTSCHSSIGYMPGKTALPMDGSELCFACHDK